MISHIVSSYESLVMIGLFIFAFVRNNLYLYVLLAGAMSKDIPVQFFKYIVDSPRPQQECADYGFPSSPVAFSTFIFVYIYYEYQRIQKETGKQLKIQLGTTGLFFILIPFLQIYSTCQTPFQIIGGMVIGIVWVAVFVLFEQTYMLQNQQYRQDKQKFISSLLE
jgi:membrane-associated phospholipid phosphatase